jgi:DNA polymerase-3 subunit epsilon
MLDVDFAVVDLETTGFAARGEDRIVEVAVLRCRPNAGIVDRFVTLVDPGRAVRAGFVHGLHGRDLAGAPRFAAIAAALKARLDGAVLVAHNSRFDVAFLEAEMARAGRRCPTGPTLCTIALASRLGVPSVGRSLRACCAAFDIAYDDGRAHGAEHDARATARLLLCLLREARSRGITTLAGLGCERAPGGPRGAGARSVASGVAAKEAGDVRAAVGVDSVADVSPAVARIAVAVRRLADGWPIGEPGVTAYLDLVDRVLLDRVITAAEADALAAMARRYALTEGDVAAAHAEYVARLGKVAWDDGVLTGDEVDDLRHVAHLLGVRDAAEDHLIRSEATWKS